MSFDSPTPHEAESSEQDSSGIERAHATDEPRLLTRAHDYAPDHEAEQHRLRDLENAFAGAEKPDGHRGLKKALAPLRRRQAVQAERQTREARAGRHWLFFVLGLLAVFALFVAGLGVWLRHGLQAALPQIEGTLRVEGLRAPVQVARDAQGVPAITAQSLNDLLFAQGFVTAQDRLWQMDALRRNAAG